MTEDQQQRQSPKEHKTIHDIRNQDLVSRLLAATPPYLYSAPVGPNNFFFSDMLRSLVQARNNENARNLQLQQSAISRRARKRSWSQHRPFYEHLKERKDFEEKLQSEKPLELTNKQLFPIPPKYSKSENKDEINAAGNNCQEKINLKSSHGGVTMNENGKLTSEFEQNVPSEMQTSIPDPATASLPPSELVLPPPPPVWYPPIYPPYGIDPLHFFIDLRVSGHIYDRKKENSSPLTNADNNNLPSTIDTESIGKHRHGSAFTVPAPRNDAKTTSAINLTSNNTEKLTNNNYAKYYDLNDSKENHPNSKNTNYVLQNLPRIYTHLTARPNPDDNSYENDSKSDQDIDEIDSELEKDTTTLIDVELIDNVKSGKNDVNSSCQSDQVHQID